ncbi:MAG: hypothetical protein ACTSUE_05690, partial [Promethearchaeota archaeon]
MPKEVIDAIYESKGNNLLRSSQEETFQKVFGVSLAHLEPAFDCETIQKDIPKTDLIPNKNVYQTNEPHPVSEQEATIDASPTYLRKSTEVHRAMKAPRTSTKTTSTKTNKRHKSSKSSTTTTTTTTTTVTLPDGTQKVTTHCGSSHTSTSNDDIGSAEGAKKAKKKRQRKRQNAASRKRKREQTMKILKRALAVFEAIEDEEEEETEEEEELAEENHNEEVEKNHKDEEEEEEESNIKMLEEKMSEMKKLKDMMVTEEECISTLRASRDEVAQEYVQLTEDQRDAKDKYEHIQTKLKELQLRCDEARQTWSDVSHRRQNKKVRMVKVDEEIDQRKKDLDSVRDFKRDLLQNNKDVGRDILEKLMSPLIGKFNQNVS